MTATYSPPAAAQGGFLRRALPALALLALTLLVFSDVLSPGRGLVSRDHEAISRPLWWSVREQILSFRLPVMNPGSPIGVPAEASNNSAPYTPMTLILLPFPFDVGYDFFVLGHVLLLAIGALVLARELGASSSAATLLAGGFTFSGAAISFQNLLVGLIGLAWVPWVLWAFLRVLRRPTRRTAAVLGLILGFHAQAISPDLLLLDLGGAALLFAWARPSLTLAHAWSLTFSIGLGLAGSAVDVWPQLEALEGSERLAGFTYEVSSGWSLSPLGIVELLAPALFAPPELPFVNVPLATGSTHDPPYLASLYVGGLLPVALSARSSRLGGLRWSRVLGLLALFFFLVSMGSHTPLHRLLSNLPLLSSSRYAIKYFLPAVAALVVLAAITLKDLEARATRIAALAFAWATAAAAGLIFVSGARGEAWLGRVLIPISGLPAFDGITVEESTRRATEAMQGRLLHALVFATGMGLICGLCRRVAWVERRLALILAAWVLLDLSTAARLAVAGVDLRDRQLDADFVERVGGWHQRVFVPRFDTAPSLSLSGRSPYESFEIDLGRRGFHSFPKVRRFFGHDPDAQGATSVKRTYDALPLLSWEQAFPLLARAGAHHIIGLVSVPTPVLMSRPDPAGRPILVYEVPGARPYVHAETSWITIPDDTESIARSTPGVPADAVMILDGAPKPHPAPAELVSGCGPNSDRSATAALDPRTSTFDRFVIESDSACEHVVVVSEPVARRWRAQVDGRPAPVLTAEVGYLGTRAPPGHHLIIFSFDSLAAKLFPLSFGAWMLGLLCLIERPRRTRDEPDGVT
ncbi:MAG: hypothetical protein HYV07_28010 [Deltaproteobacteria bacterium]|nr:hypothetical protein [Deltaproteobacteria bacterium]